jgi:hypothetical protein
MSYGSYERFLKELKDDELTFEVARLRTCVEDAESIRGREAWKKMLQMAQSEQLHR